MLLQDRCVLDTTMCPAQSWAALARSDVMAGWAAGGACGPQEEADLVPGSTRSCTLDVAGHRVEGLLSVVDLVPFEHLRLHLRTPVVAVATSMVQRPRSARQTTVFVDVDAHSPFAAALRPWFIRHVDSARSALAAALSTEGDGQVLR